MLVGISTSDTQQDADKLSKKIANLRIFEDEQDGQMWKRSVKDIKGEILSVSQFTLMAKTVKGTKPDLHLAQRGDLAKPLYDHFLAQLGQEIGSENVKDGVFGAMMDVALTNEGPITLIVDTNDTK